MARAVAPYRERLVLLRSDREGDGNITDVRTHITKEEFETQEMKDRVTAYHESLNKHIDSESEYANEENGDDFIKDDEELPIGYEENGTILV